MQPAQGSRLDSWKEIAAYLRRNVRTVTRWAEKRGLPVHRVPGGKRGTVFAFTEEIDAWLVRQEKTKLPSGASHQGSSGEDGAGSLDAMGTIAQAVASVSPAALGGLTTPAAPMEGGESPQALQRLVPIDRNLPQEGGRSKARPHNWGLVGVAAAAILLALIPITRVLRPASSEASQLFSIKFEVNALEAQDARGQALWEYRYAQPLRSGRFQGLPRHYEPSLIGDFLRDGSKQAAVAVALRSGPNVTDEDRNQVDFFSSDGKRLWSYFPDKSFQFGNYLLGGRWNLHDLFASAQGSQTKLWAAACHHIFGDAFIVQLDPRTGKDKLRFVNTGTVYRLNEIKTPAGAFLLVGGFNSEWDGGSLAIINEERPFAASPQTPGSRHHCDSCPPGDPDYYFVFPRSEINRASTIYENPVIDVRVSGDGIEVVKVERFNEGKETVINLLDTKPPFNLLGPLYNSEYNVLHATWSAEGKLSHKLENCPERLHPKPVRLWTPAAGWTEIPVKPAKANQ